MLARNTERYVQKKEAYGILGISRATFDRWRKKYENFPKSRNPNPKGRCLFWLPDLLKWAAENR
jgi:predicted DNA-binding transcriptional regulator AlpA